MNFPLYFSVVFFFFSPPATIFNHHWGDGGSNELASGFQGYATKS